MREMKDSGVEWIGDIPVGWKLSKIGAIYEERNVKVSDNDYVPLSVTKKGIVPQLETAAKTDNGDNRKLIKRNDFVINSRSDRRGSCGISKFDGSCSLINTVLKPRKNMHNAYYDFVFHSDLFADEFYAWGNGIVDDLWSTKWSSMKRIYIPAPPIDEQIKIADYLDDKCSKIDAIIAKQEKIIEKLKEYRIATITDVVTHGIQNERSTKESGVPFIGDIPKSWIVTKLKYMTDAIGDGIHSTPVYDEAGKIHFVNGNNIGKDFIEFKENTNTINDSEYSHYKEPLMTENTILITLNGATYGKTSFYHNEKILLGKSAGYITLKNGENREYVRYYLQSSIAKLIMELSLLGSTIANLSLRTLNDFIIIYPPLQEQKEIVIHLNSVCASIDKQVACREQLISKLTEYKKSLIYECVTGKKEII